MRRIDLIPASGILSSYKKKYKKERWDISAFEKNRGNYICPDMFEALLKLDSVVKQNKGEFYITDLFRSWETQSNARNLYETGKKRAFVAKPGGSFHGAGRAIDISVKELNFENLQEEHWLEKLWELAKPIGFHPIIKIPDLYASEAWHFDFPGPWKHAYDTISYSEVAKCAILDVGEWDVSVPKDKIKKMFIQSQLIRLGHYDIGKVDGIIGSKTMSALELENLDGKTVEDVLAKELSLR